MTARCGCGGWPTGRRSGCRCAATTALCTTVAVGSLPDGTPVIVSGGGYDDDDDDVGATVRVWRLADGAPVGEPLRGHDGYVKVVAVGELPDGTAVIVSGGNEDKVRVWRLGDGATLVPPLVLPGLVQGLAVTGNFIVTAARAEIAAHRIALPQRTH